MNIFTISDCEKRRMPQNITVVVSYNIDSSILEDICMVAFL